MNPSGHDEDENGAEDGGSDDRDELGFDQIEIEHQAHAWRYEEEGQVEGEELGNSFDPVQFHNAQLEQEGERQHSDDAGGQFGAGEIDQQLPEGEASEDDGTLKNHVFHILFVLKCKDTRNS